LSNDYPQVGGQYEVIHHSQLLAELIAQGRLIPIDGDAAKGQSITYHDPCYLARANGVTEAPRAVLATAVSKSSELPILELPRNRRQTSCCGAGGGRMWFDDALAQRVGQGRVREIANSGAGTVAVACPFCLIMLGDGLAAATPKVKVRDIAEVLAEAVLGAESLVDQNASRSPASDGPSKNGTFDQ
jgi:Fe-S oxidoreductase